MLLHQKDRNKLVGIDIQETYLKVLELAYSGTSIKIKNFGLLPIANTAIIHGDIKNTTEISNAVAEIRTNTKINATNAAIAINGSLVMTKKVTLFNSTNTADIEAQVWLEADKIFPKLVNNINLDFHVLGSNKVDANKIDVLLVACRKDIIQSRIDAFKTSGFELKTIDVNYYALERTFPTLAQQLLDDNINKTMAILNLDGKIATLIVIKDQALTFSNEQICNIQPIDNWLLHILENSKNKVASTAINTLKATVIEQVFHILQFFYTSKQNTSIDYLFLSGEHATLPDIAVNVEKKVDIKTLIANPFINIDFGKKLDEAMLTKIAPAFTICCGLAKRGLRND